VTSGSDKPSLLQSRETFSSPCFPRVKQVREKFSFEDEDENENHYTTPKLHAEPALF
jgi:hypothetical protein